MGLLNIVRGAVKIADKVTLDLQPEVTLSHYAGQNGYGANIYGTPTTIKAIVEHKQAQVKSLEGEPALASSKITFLNIANLLSATGNEGVNRNDKIVLPSGETGPILAFGGFIDAGTGIEIATEVYLG